MLVLKNSKEFFIYVQNNKKNTRIIRRITFKKYVVLFKREGVASYKCIAYSIRYNPKMVDHTKQ